VPLSSTISLAFTSTRWARRASAAALPRPSAMLSAKLANRTVNHSHTATCSAHHGLTPVRKASMVESVARMATISVARITGLRASLRGSSLTKESAMARAMTPEDRAVEVTAERRFSPRWTETEDISIAPKGSADGVEHLEVLHDRAEGLGGEELQAAHDEDHADQQADEQRAMRRQGAGRRCELGLGGDGTSHGQHRHHIAEAAQQHRDPQGRVPVGDVGREAGEGGAVVPGRRGVGVEDLGQAV